MNKDIRNLIVFFLATFTWTWACYVPIAVSGHSPYEMPWLILFIAGGMGPSLIGVLLVMFTYGKDRRRDYWRRCFSFFDFYPHNPTFDRRQPEGLSRMLSP
jgi:hypothetical protein